MDMIDDTNEHLLLTQRSKRENIFDDTDIRVRRIIHEYRKHRNVRMARNAFIKQFNDHSNKLWAGELDVNIMRTFLLTQFMPHRIVLNVHLTTELDRHIEQARAGIYNPIPTGPEYIHIQLAEGIHYTYIDIHRFNALLQHLANEATQTTPVEKTTKEKKRTITKFRTGTRITTTE